jgi:hypothetical protein
LKEQSSGGRGKIAILRTVWAIKRDPVSKTKQKKKRKERTK